MYLSDVSIEGYKAFSSKTQIPISQGLCVILGENASGKSTIIDAIRLILQEDEFGLTGISDTDFHRGFKPGSTSASRISVNCTYSDLSKDEKIRYSTWLNSSDLSKAQLSIQIENKISQRGYYKKEIWGGDSLASAFERDLLDRISCVYLPPLRDAEHRLKAIRGSRLSRLFRSLQLDEVDKSSDSDLIQRVRKLNTDLITEDPMITKVNDLIKDQLVKALGDTYGQTTSIQFTEVSFQRIVESLRLLYYPDIANGTKQIDLESFRELNQNSLGYNNLIYLATVLAEFEGLAKETGSQDVKILLIEEPEAHLHPQLQLRLMDYFKQAVTDSKNIQIIVTTHSPTITSITDISNLNVIANNQLEGKPNSVLLDKCINSEDTSRYLKKWLDVTKSIMLFSRGVLLVEGISEALIIPILADNLYRERYKTNNIMKNRGVSIVNINGISFKHFLTVFLEYSLYDDAVPKPYLNIKCAAIADKDPDKYADVSDRDSSDAFGIEKYCQVLDKSKNCKLYVNTLTFEYDLALVDGNFALMADVLCGMYKSNTKTKQELISLKSKDWAKLTTEEKEQAATKLLQAIKKRGKADFALKLSVSENKHLLNVPQYIDQAFKWLIN